MLSLNFRNRTSAGRAKQQPVHTGRSPKRRGSVIVVVIALLGSMMVLGILFLMLSAQEEENAEFFADSAKDPQGVGVTVDTLMDFALEQIILGPDDNTYYNSALWGGRASLLATLVGTDLQPFDGPGVNLVWDTASTQPVVDANYDGSDDGTDDTMELNQSPVAQMSGTDDADDIGLTTTGLVGEVLPQPDVGYSYPDINSPFLCYIGTEPTSGEQIVIPSYHRPQYVRLNASDDGSDWYYNNTNYFRRRVMRPHRGHEAVLSDGTLSGVPRFPQTAAELEAAGLYDDADTSGTLDPTTEAISFFPLQTETSDVNGNGTLDSYPILEGHWTNDGSTTYAYDADADGDSIKEAVYLDLDYPIQTTADGSISFVPLFAITIYDLDGLFNLNAHGNAYGDVALNSLESAQEFGDGAAISQSNLGTGPHEVNPQWALTEDPSTGNTDQHKKYLGITRALGSLATDDPLTPTVDESLLAPMVELANVEWWWLLTGRPELDTSTGAIETTHAGRWGEVDRLQKDYSGSATLDASTFPLPGTSETDDNGNQSVGSSGSGDGTFFSTFISSIPHIHPLDFKGNGSMVASGSGGKNRLLVTIGRMYFPSYNAYETLSGYSFANGYDGWMKQLSEAGASISPMTSPFLSDEPAETLLTGTSTDDSIFGASETGLLHMTAGDLSATGASSRLQSLAPRNMAIEEIRKRFTTIGSDLKQFAKPRINASQPAVTRAWEWDSSNAFPPLFGVSSEPFRQEAGYILGTLWDSTNNQGDRINQYLMRKLSPNHIAARDRDGRYILRPLVPHPTSLPSTAITPLAGSFGVPDASLTVFPWNISSAAQQEWHARRDRQNLARDIFVLLYTLAAEGDPRTSAATAFPDESGTIPGRTTEVKILELAQYAVNLVDAMDEDDIITAFVCDVDLSNGYLGAGTGTQDDGYIEVTSANADPDRRVVYGVEQQKLVLSEAIALITRKVQDSSSQDKDHPLTSWNDKEENFFTYFELMNVTPQDVDLDYNWQVVVVPSDASGNAVGSNTERQLTFANTTVSASGNPVISVGSTRNESNSYNNNYRYEDRNQPDPDNKAEADNWSTLEPSTNPAADASSILQVDTTFSTSSSTTTNADIVADSPENYLPVSGDLTLDLLDNTDNTKYLLHESPGASGDYTSSPIAGTVISGTAANERGPELVKFDIPLITLVDSPATRKLRLVLRRRLNTRRAGVTDPTISAQSFDNPWVTVDEMSVDIERLELAYEDVTTDLHDKLVTVKSTERLQPFGRDNQNEVDNSAIFGASYNSLGAVYSNSPDPYDVWQPHYDRPFASLADVLQVPLYSPENLTDEIVARDSGNNLRLDRRAIGASRFLFPEGSNLTLVSPTGELGSGDVLPVNLWYRIFEFLEIPTRHGEYDSDPWFIHAIGTTSGTGDREKPVQFGKVNLNMLRHPHVLGGMIDDTDVIDGSLLYSGSNTDPLPSANSETFQNASARDWWNAFIQSRDGFDPITSSYILPGLPARADGSDWVGPFQPFGRPLRWDSGLDLNASFNDTLLRRLPGDDFTNDLPRGLFELGDRNEVDTAQFNFSTRYRELGKILNNATTRSNSFVCFIKIDYFEAVSRDHDSNAGTPDITQIGGKLTGSPGYRGVFVIDRARALELLQTGHLPTDPAGASTGEPFTYSFARQSVNGVRSPVFDWNQLVLSRKIIQ
ncbi:hypothetical protein [Calycomorphotria hydatis]|uniref:Uncharacterized protein n=1 Tax=Calycomorphotria hydatis TaxID=2528027 RepID=A0A517T5U6_9PLAN|nr:hypothetical protein [Calycomorphotria hydatis]QDT63755.1 hypothetical protein V22_09800 [Calycomorphotria hydatis]